MRCCYMSDLHLERQEFDRAMPEGDVLIVAGDLCQASCLDPARKDMYSAGQRSRVHRFIDSALASFPHVLMIAGNHEHYVGVFEETASLLRRHCPGVTVLDDELVEIEGVRFFGATLWTDFDGRSRAAMDGVRKRMGEYFFVEKRSVEPGPRTAARFQPEDALAAFDASWAALERSVVTATGRKTVVTTHHAPSRQGLRRDVPSRELDSAYASDLDAKIAALGSIAIWIHGHTHIRRTYRIGETRVMANCRGFDGRDPSAREFKPNAFFEIQS